MANEYDIFKRLKEYETQPPPEVMIRIFNSLDADKKSQYDEDGKGFYEQLQELEINPPEFLYSSIEQRINIAERLTLLKDFETAPPARTFSFIIDKINAENKWKTGGSAVAKIVYRYRAIAAAVLIMLTGWFIYRLAHPSSRIQPGDITIKKNLPPAVSKTDTVRQNINADNKSMAAGVKKVKRVLSTESSASSKMSVDDYFFPVMNNDLLATFSGFNYRQIPFFVRDNSVKSFTVRVDQYSAISVSGNMTKMIRKMNSFRRSGKLTHRAKKARAKLEKWKKADAEQFDRSLMNNPLDAVDLAEFIFN